MEFLYEYIYDEKPENVSEKVHQNRMNQKKEIIKTAFRLFGQKGYYKTTLEDIGHEIGITRAALYRYFSSKDELLFQCHKVVYEFALNNLKQLQDIQSPSERMTKMLESHILSYFHEDFPLSYPTLLSLSSFPEVYKNQVKEYRKMVEEPYFKCLKDWRCASPDQLKDMDDRIIINTFFNAANSVPRWWDGKSDPTKIAKNVVAILVDGIKHVSS
ncbi:TetR/AcrR family transcriptional regulator [Neobacillus rhizophilus]|uniref:TetR/AcrR family transcriptional regulator n=1 Tax=Neobacillus rhizophilus TaxID=2833579 RepID=A0A942UAG8_9BACI|nr:TetR/AcrR family transcriptional regulator [Neobacillus rhizophilus]MBS4215193.1 TetR/AcrR family transcriptional regulator [Neobacillus rhizophilus]